MRMGEQESRDGGKTWIHDKSGEAAGFGKASPVASPVQCTVAATEGVWTAVDEDTHTLRRKAQDLLEVVTISGDVEVMRRAVDALRPLAVAAIAKF
jgi:hypothetical protein